LTKLIITFSIPKDTSLNSEARVHWSHEDKKPTFATRDLASGYRQTVGRQRETAPPDSSPLWL